MIKLNIQDSTSSLDLPILEVPLAESTIELATDIQTLDGNVYTDFISQKRSWSHTWVYMSLSDYNLLRGFYDRQFTLFKYPLLTIDFYSISAVPVRMYIDKKSIIDNCGTLGGVTVTFRETAQEVIS